MKLKTLKDLKDNKPTNYNKNCRVAWDDFVYVKDLKAEAVKYYKDLQKHATMDLTTTDAQLIIGAMRWIKHFFNLIEEDLK